MSDICKYYKQKKRVSYDSGTTWQDVVPAEYQKGSLYERNSPDCGSILAERWVNSGTTCSGDSGNDKYYIQVKQTSNDGGITWITTSDYRLGSLIELNSSDCMGVQYKWFETSDYICSDCIDAGYSYTIPSTDYTYYGSCHSGGCFGWNDGYEQLPYTVTDSSDMTSLKLYGCYTTVGWNAFQAHKLEKVELPNTIISIGVSNVYGTAFGNCVRLKDCAIPDSVTAIYNGAFQGCTSLTNVFLPNSVTTIGPNAFRGCCNFTTINIPSGVTTIENSTFSGCYGLSDIELHSGITSIGNYAFYNCSNLNNVTIKSTTPPALGSSVFNGTSSSLKIYVPSESVNIYKTTAGWSDYANKIYQIP